MGIEHERAFEDEIVEHLGANGWLVSSSDRDPRFEYDKTRGFIPGDVFAWLEATQPGQLARNIKPDLSDALQAQAREQLLDRLAKVLATPPEHGGGTLNVLRKGFKNAPASFTMAQFKPATSLNPTDHARYDAMRLRVMRQVHYSRKGAQTIDLVLFVNGIPVATLELKTDNVQSIEDAKNQYRNDRRPTGEPLLTFGRGALVHFAVSNDEVWMTTKLAGKDTRFLPFNRGNGGRSGNAPIPGKSATSYLWEEILDRDTWLNILGSFLHLDISTQTDPITGEVTTRKTLLFPRYHQWQVVTSILESARKDGPGCRYLVQHSAGSGKTNSIAWLAHGLSHLHDEHDNKVFDSVIVITDRNVLDNQLQRAIRELEGTEGVVANINADAIRKLGDDSVASKSSLLAHELRSRRLIVVVTLQTFPFALEAIRSDTALAGRNFAVIADEAHSSQTGHGSQHMITALTPGAAAARSEDGEVDTEEVLAAELENRASTPNISFFAFTATPKSRTLELFGDKDADGNFHPFHVYTMQQAVEEGFILDVLRNYTSYETAFKIAEEQRHLEIVDDNSLVESRSATVALMRWVSLHPENINQKVEIIVEHYRSNVQRMLDGHAKAMVVTRSREHAARYKAAMDAYIASKGYRLGTLVAFSGSLTDEVIEPQLFPRATAPYSESNLNLDLRGRSIPAVFSTDDFQILIVADKYQTGFDQPLLCGMYVDKRLAGITAVQTLSRLNRTYAAGGKDTTYILDFVNDPEEILEAFQTYYQDAELEGSTDPNQVYDIEAKLDAAGIYTRENVEAFADAYLRGGAHSDMQSALQEASNRFKQQLEVARRANDKAAVTDLEEFRSTVGKFLRLYDFLSQIVNYEDTYLEKLALYLRLLQRRLTTTTTKDPLDLTNVELAAIKQVNLGPVDLRLDDDVSSPLKPATEVGSGGPHDPKLVRLREIIDRLNELFGGEFSPGAIDAFQTGIVADLEENTHLRDRAVSNSKSLFLESPDLESEVEKSLLKHNSTQSEMVQRAFSDETRTAEIIRLLGELAWQRFRDLDEAS